MFWDIGREEKGTELNDSVSFYSKLFVSYKKLIKTLLKKSIAFLKVQIYNNDNVTIPHGMVMDNSLIIKYVLNENRQWQGLRLDSGQM